ncbi:MAG: xanthine phosphoribosyltransferase [Eubacterium sp.]|jgi:xanthine phosphoribosyltransferase|nr:xanthine phosphoribosyltransferase [Eubacterium sp.]
MKLLEERIKKDGRVYPGNILKVDSFLNHQIDVSLMDQIGDAFYEAYKDCGITKILTIEASGIAIACSTARRFGVPLLFAKKTRSLNIGNDVYTATVSSFTYKQDYQVVISKRYLSETDHVVIVDDFLATGNAMLGLADLCKMAGASVDGIGICIEKGFQNGGKQLRDMGYSVTSLAVIDSMTDDGKIVFRS